MPPPTVNITPSRPVVRVRSTIAWLPERFLLRETRIKVAFTTSPGERHLYRKKKRQPPSLWAPKYRKITYGPLKGSYYDPDFMPHMNGIMDTAAESCVQEITNCKAPQTGGSANWETFLGNRADVAPADTLIVYPDRNTAANRCKDYLTPMFTSSPRLRKLLTGVSDDLASVRVRLKTMMIYMGWSGSISSLGNVSVKYLLIDELDKCLEYPSKKEASFEDLVGERTTAFDRFGSIKIWNSTPTATPSRIVRKLRQMDVIFDYHGRCPDCGHVQRMEFKRIDFNGVRDPQQMIAERHARYICAACGSSWDDLKRDRAVRSGGWYARNEAERDRLIKADKWQGQPVGLERGEYLRRYRPVKVGFHSPAWISPLNELAKCAAAFLKGIKDEKEMIYFVTQIAADEYTHHQKQRQEDVILALRDDRPEGLVPSGCVVCALVAGSDTQDKGNFYWIDAVGWGLEQERWRIRAGYVETEAALEQVVFGTEYKDIDGNVYPVQLMVRDAMGHRTTDVYRFCLKHPGRCVPYKGATGRRSKPWVKTVRDRWPGSNKPIPGGLDLYTCDSHHYKDLASSKLAIKSDDPGAWHMDQDMTDEQAKHLCAEIRDEHFLWQNPGKLPEHYWDSCCLSVIASDLLQLKFRIKPVEAPAPPPKKESKPNPYTGGRSIFGR